MIFIITAISFVLVLNFILAFWFFRREQRKRVRELLQLKLFLIRLPRSSSSKDERGSRQEVIKQEINFSEQLMSALAAFKKPVVFEVAVPHVGDEIHFYAGVPERYADVFVRQIQSIWADSQVSIAEDYTIFNHDGAASVASVTLKEKFFLPIRTYQEIGTDTFAPILGGLTKISEIGEGGAFQFIMRPAPKDAKKKIFSALQSLKKGRKIKSVLNDSIDTQDLYKAATQGTKKKEEPNEKIIDEEAVKGLEMKFSKPLFEVNIRVVASAPTKEQADILLDGMTAGFSQFSSPQRNEFKFVRPRNTEQFIYQFVFREFSNAQTITLSSEEFASVFHLPTSHTEIPKIKYLKFKEAPPPPSLPKEGLKIGENNFQGIKSDICLTREDRRRHLYIVGQTGTGKSVLLNNLSGQDMQNGEGLCVMDPNGDLVEDVLGRVPRERVKDVIVFDPGDMSRPLGLNMLEYDPEHPEQKTFIINELMTIFDTLYDLKNTGGPMFEQYARNALLLLMDDPNDGYTLMEVPKVLSDSEFRKKLLAKCKNYLTKDFWEKEAEKAGGEASLANLVPYISSKFNTFIANDYMRPIIAQSKTSLNFRKIMDEGKILVVNLSKGRIGDLNASLLGMIIVGKLTIAAFARGDVPMNERKDFYLYIDEFQNFTTPSIATILSEARKYRLNLTIAHQFIGQLSDKIRDAVFGNVGSIIAFRIGADDAEFLVKQFEPVFTESNLINIDNLNAHAKILVKDKVYPPFNIFEPFPPRGDKELAELVKEHSRLVNGRPREIVEEEIFNRLKGSRV
jgi:hypothetical protein